MQNPFAVLLVSILVTVVGYALQNTNNAIIDIVSSAMAIGGVFAVLYSLFLVGKWFFTNNKADRSNDVNTKK